MNNDELINEGTNQVNHNRPYIPLGCHPIDTGYYLISTNEIARMYKEVVTWIQRRTPGAMIVGNPRLGKTRAIKYLVNSLPSVDIVGLDTPIYTIKCSKFKNPNESDFFECLLKDVKHHTPLAGRAISKRRRLYNFLIEKGLGSSRSRVIMFLDDAQRLHELHYEWLMDIYNELESEGILLTVILVGQRELFDQRTAFLLSNKKQIIGRFMVDDYKFKGIGSIDDIRLCLKNYDEDAIYPLGTNWTFTRYFFPVQYKQGFRLSNFSDILLEVFQEVATETGSKGKIEIPMFYFSSTIENALRYLGIDGSNVEQITKSHWKYCIRMSGYINAERYSEVLKHDN
ncbi:ATP-binding protein [Ectobacillus antri]|uniref:ATP-binding protein n=1 Tax=Ectobacillus antri TaxID=2486280 RepID=A0ABT6H3U0_9BACI|nr:ATP-binding protein [Ectobacillus antri]MDG4656411.1 ATP-binding protein [Ectobacillus antri]MDG5753086.1 ATP-binding protein [Ectobacillus antri]